MMQYGLIGNAEHGGHSSPTFDLIAGFSVLALTWVSYFREKKCSKVSIWAALEISAICAAFIGSGIWKLMNGGKEIMRYGFVGNAAYGGHGRPAFDLIVGFSVLALAWVNYFRGKTHSKISILVSIGMSAICAVFIGSGIWKLLH